jgi:hypothetical protein
VDQPPVAEILQDDRAWEGQAMTAADVRQRSEIARYLRPSLFPAGSDQLAGGARDAGAPDWVIGALRRLPRNVVFRNVEEVWRALGGTEEAPV